MSVIVVYKAKRAEAKRAGIPNFFLNLIEEGKYKTKMRAFAMYPDCIHIIMQLG